MNVRVIDVHKKYFRNIIRNKSDPVQVFRMEIISTTSIPPKYQDYSDIFDETKAHLKAQDKEWDIRIKLVGPPPAPSRLYVLSDKERRALEVWVQDQLDKGFIVPSQSLTCAPVFFVPKKDGGIRLCTDYRKLNAITERNAFPIPLIDEVLENIRRHKPKIFTKLDLKSAFTNLSIHGDDRWKTAFSTHLGLYEYVRMPFGLANAPPMWQAFISDTLKSFLGKICEVYIDDIIIYSRSPEEHTEHVRAIMEVLRSRGLVLSNSKCAFDVFEVDFLGLNLSTEGIKRDPVKNEAILQWKLPPSSKNLSSFLGFANFYRRWIPDFAGKTSRLYEIAASKDKLITWTDSLKLDFEQIKQEFRENEILVWPRAKKQFIMVTDGSETAVGGCLFQGLDDYLPKAGEKLDYERLCPVACYSRKLREAEYNYPIHDKELLAIMVALGNWRHWLIATDIPVCIYTDHKNLTYFLQKSKLNRRQLRWSEVLADYNIVIRHLPGRENVADPLTRKAEYQLSPEELMKYETELFKQKDQEIVVRYIEVNCPKERLKIMKTRHDLVFSAHPGVKKTYQLIRKDFHWTKMREEIDKYVKGCIICQRSKVPRQKPNGLLQPLPVPSRPFGTVTMDFIVALPTVKQYNAVLVFVDRFTKFAIFVPTTDKATAVDVAEIYLSHLFSRFGLSDIFISDRGPQFDSKFWYSICSSLGIDRRLSTAYHPQTDGQSERVNQVLEQFLRVSLNYAQDNWLSLLPLVEFAYNNSPHSATNIFPFFALYGFHPKSDNLTDIILQNQRQVSHVPAAVFIQEKAQLHAAIVTSLEKARHTMKKYADKKRTEITFAVGDKVMLRCSEDRPKPKLGMKYLGPFDVVEKINDGAYRLKLPKSWKIHDVLSISALKPFVRDEFNRPKPSKPSSLLVDGRKEYEVEEILDRRTIGKKNTRVQYLVKWKDYGPEDNTWEFPSNLIHCEELVKEYEQKNVV